MSTHPAAINGPGNGPGNCLGNRATQGANHSETSKRIALATNLVNEWRHTAVNRRAIATANSWGLPGEPLRDLFELVHRAGFEKPANDVESDDYLASLMRVAKRDQLAARAVLQRLLAGLLSIAARRAPITDDGIVGSFGRLVSAAWMVIVHYPIETRSRRVAANLLLDIEYTAFVREERRVYNFKEMRVDTTSLEQAEAESHGFDSADTAYDGAAVELMINDMRRHGLNDRDIEMIRMVQHELQSVEVCEALGLADRSVRSRREVALRKARNALRDWQ